MKNKNGFIIKNKEILIILFISLIVRLFFQFRSYDLWWDEATYIIIGKYIFSLGELGLWESLRPLLLPVILGLFWKIGLPVIIMGKILILISSLAVIYLIYLIAKRLFNKKVAIIASLFMSFSAVFFIYNFLILTEIISIMFALLGIYLFINEKRFLPGIFVGASALTKFTGILFIFPLLTSVIFNNYHKNKNFFSKLILKESILLISGFILILLPYFILNFVLYNNPIYPFIESGVSIVKDAYCNVIFFNPWYYYLKTLFIDNPLNVFSIFGLYLTIKKRLDIKKITVIVSLILSLLWFSQLHCRHYRYTIYILPFVAIFASYGIYWLLKKHKKLFGIFLVLFVLFATPYIISEQNSYFPNLPKDITERYYKFLENKKIDEEIWVSSPWPALYTTKKVNPIYYPIYDHGLAKNFHRYIMQNSSKISYIFFDNYGGVICNPKDTLCIEENKNILTTLKDNYETVFYGKFGKYEYFIFRNI